MISLVKESADVISKGQGVKLMEMSSHGYKIVYSGSVGFQGEENKDHLFFLCISLKET